MSGHKNQARVNQDEFTAIKAQLKEAGVTEVAKATGRSMATISKIKRSATHAKFCALNSSYRHKQPATAKTVVSDEAGTQTIPPLVINTDNLTSKQHKQLKKAIKVSEDVSRLMDKRKKPLAADGLLIDKLAKPTRHTKAEASEILALRAQLDAAAQERDALRTANELLNEVNADLSAELNQYHEDDIHRVIESSRQSRTVQARLARVFGRKA